MRHVPPAAALILATSWAALAHANGTTLMPGGAASVSRGGAIAARAEDTTIMATNPAALAFLSGPTVAGGVDVPFQKMCVDPYGYYGWGIDKTGTSEFGSQTDLGTPSRPGYATTPLSPVCNSAGTLPIPSSTGGGFITKDLAYAIGFVAPVLVPGQQYGGSDGTVETPYGPRPTPTRYTLVRQRALYAGAPSFSLAYRIIPELAAGFTFQITSVVAEQTQVQNPFGGTAPTTDFLTTVTTQDLFIPALTFSVHAKPTPALNLMAAFKWSDDFRGSGDVAFETNTYYRGSGLANAPYRNSPTKLSDLDLKLPWAVIAGIRYAGLLPAEKGAQRSDPLSTERWDLEFDLEYDLTARTATNSVSFGQDITVVTHTATGGTGQSKVSANDLGTLNVNRHLKDTYALRLGGSYSVLPRKFAVNAGVFYESRGIDLAYADIDSFTFRRIGASVGLMVRIGKKWDLRFGATHIASETVEVAPGPNQSQVVGGSFDALGNRVGGKVLTDPGAPAPGKADAVAAKPQSAVGSRAAIINAGRYTASFDVLSVGFAVHF